MCVVEYFIGNGKREGERERKRGKKERINDQSTIVYCFEKSSSILSFVKIGYSFLPISNENVKM